MPSPLAPLWSLDPTITFLNHGSFGACPRAIVDSQRELRAQMEREPVDFLWRKLEGPLDASRAEVARLVKASAETVAFVPNATSAVNAVLRSLEFAPGDELLTTDHAYNACRNVLVEVARRSGAKVVVAHVPFPISGSEEIVSAVLGAVTSQTRLALLDHVTSPTALIFPLATLIRELTARGVETLVDGAHAPGMLPLDLPALGASYYTGNLHKWLCAPRGTGFLYVRADRQETIQPSVISHGYNTRRPGRSALHDRFDWQGTGDVTAWLCAGEAIRWCASLFPGGLDELMRHNHALAVAARTLLCERLQLNPPGPDAMLGSMATLPLPARFQGGDGPSSAVIERFDPDQMRLFEEFQIEIPFLRWGAPPRRWFRISAQAYNALSDYEVLAKALAVL
jgi:isopenicillin-N epimerase